MRGSPELSVKGRKTLHRVAKENSVIKTQVYRVGPAISKTKAFGASSRSVHENARQT